MHMRRAGEWLLIDESQWPGQWPEKWLRRLRARDGIRQEKGLIKLHLFVEQDDGFEPSYEELDVCYEDDFCLVVNKPAGVAVHPSSPEDLDTLANRVAGHYVMTGQRCAVKHIHRLDLDTTGPVLYAKNEWAGLVLDEDMRNKAIDRMYVALCSGSWRLPEQGTISAAIGRDRHHATRRRVSPTGQEAVTHYTVLESFEKAAFVQLQLETGRTHQIRVHMQHLGHPLIGDTLYGGKPVGTFRRQALHGQRLQFMHPWSRESIQVEAGLPHDMQNLLDVLRG
ncbi:RluA family pseudouridine synthase [Marinicrinis sediminis]|uniref:Pseudouridine synthase n=1 Tax=Marinicrinis sediminis TaxID=1652465 RepID=A0ABW5R6A0_9BACL